MKKILGTVIALLMIGTSQANTNQNGNVLYGKPTNTVAQQKTVIRKGPALVKKIQKPKIFSGKPQRPVFLVDDWEDIIEVDDVITSYRREDLNKIEHDDNVPEHIRWRLFLARQLALLKYQEIMSQKKDS